MSQEIDERIVSMQFDNENFEKNISKTMQSLDDLDEQINDSVQNTGGSFSDVISGLDKLDAVWLGFYTRVGGYMAELAVKAADFAKSLAVEPIKQGFDKYTSETLAAQTVVSNAGDKIKESFGFTSDDEVVKKTYDALGEIANYADRTSYSYSNLSDTMSKMVMGGTNLDDAVEAVKGIGNWAAITGAGIEKANMVMPALVKSFNAGYLRLRDWQNVQANSMADPKFTQRLIDNARKYNKEMVKWEKKNGKITVENFTENAFGSNKFVTAEALIETLKMYGDETSDLGQEALAAAAEAKTFKEAVDAVQDAVSTGWGQTFRYIFGDYQEARKFFTFVQDALLDVFTIGQEFRNEVLRIWHVADEGGWKDMLDGFQDFWDGLKQLVKPIGDAFHEIFGLEDAGKTAQKLIDATKNFREFAKEFKEFYEKPGNLYEKLFGKGKDGEKTIFTKRVKLLQAYYADPAKKILDDIYSAFKGLFDVVKIGIDVVKGFFGVLRDVWDEVKRLIQPVLDLAGAVGDYIDGIKRAADDTGIIQTAFDGLSKIINSVVKPAIDTIIEWLGKLSGKFKETDSYSKFKDIFEKLSGAINDVSDYISGKLKDAFDWLKDAAEKIGEKLSPLKDTFKDIKDTIGDFFGKTLGGSNESKVKGFFDGLLKIVGKVSDFLLDKAVIPALDGMVKLISGLWTDVIKPMGEPVKELISAFSDLFKSGNGQDAHGTKTVISDIAETIVKVVKYLSDNAVKPVIDWITDKVKQLKDNTTPLGKAFENAKTAITGFFDNLVGKEDDVEKSSSVLEFFVGVAETLGKIGGFVVNTIKNIGGVLKDLFGDIDQLNFSKIIEIVAGILTGRALYNLGSLFGNLADITGAFSTFMNTILGYKESKSILIDIGKGLLYLAAAVLIIASIDSDKLEKAIPVVQNLLISLSVALAVISMSTVSNNKFSNNSVFGVKVNGINGFASNVVDMAVAILIIAAAIKMISKIDADKESFERAKNAIEEIIIVVGAFDVATTRWGGQGKPTGLIQLGIALYLIASALKKLAKDVDAGSLVLASEVLIKIIVALAAFTMAAGALGENKKGLNVTLKMKTTLLQLAVVIIALAALIYIIATKVNNENKDTIITAIAAIGGLVVALSLLAAVAKNLQVGGKKTVQIYSLVGVLAALAGVLVILNKTDPKKVLGGLLAMVVAFAELVALAGVIENISVDISNLIDVMLLVAAMAAMAGVFVILSSLNIDKVYTGLLAMAVAFTGLFAAALVAMTIAPALEFFSEILLKMSIAALAFAAAAWLFAEALRAIVSAVSDAVPIVEAGGDEFVTKFSDTFDSVLELAVGFIPKIVKFVVDLVIAIVDQIAESAFDIIESVVKLLYNIADALEQNADMLGDAVAALLVALLKIVWSFLKNLFFDLVEWFGGTKEEVVNWFKGVWKAIKDWVTNAWNNIKEWWQAIKDAWNTMWEAIGQVLSDIDEAISGAVEDVLGFFSDLWEGFTGVLSDLWETLTGWIDDLIGALKAAWDWVKGLFSPENNEDAIKDAEATGKAITEGATRGLKDKKAQDELKKAAKGNAQMLIGVTNKELAVRSPSRVFAEIGRFVDLGLAKGITEYSAVVSDASSDLAATAVNPMQEAVSAIGDIDTNGFSDPVIRPVLDLTDVQNGARSIGSMFGGYSTGLSFAGVSGSLKTESSSSAPMSPISINVYGAEGQDVNQLADIVMGKINSAFNSRSSVWK